MCMVSAIFDKFEPIMPKPGDSTWPGWTVPYPDPSALTVDPNIVALRALIEEFRTMVAAAKRVDKLTGQPDCEDPSKAKLEERVAALEKAMARIQGAFTVQP